VRAFDYTNDCSVVVVVVVVVASVGKEKRAEPNKNR